MSTVDHAVELGLDGAAERRVGSLLDALEARGIATILAASPHVHAHVSLAVLGGLTPEEIASSLDGVAGEALPAIVLSSLGAFCEPVEVVFLGVTPTPELLGLNKRVHMRLAATRATLRTHYEPRRWVPHCTLAMRPASLVDALGAVRDAIARDPLPIEATAVEVRIIEVPTGRVVATVP